MINRICVLRTVVDGSAEKKRKKKKNSKRSKHSHTSFFLFAGGVYIRPRGHSFGLSFIIYHLSFIINQLLGMKRRRPREWMQSVNIPLFSDLVTASSMVFSLESNKSMICEQRYTPEFPPKIKGHTPDWTYPTKQMDASQDSVNISALVGVLVSY